MEQPQHYHGGAGFGQHHVLREGRLEVIEERRAVNGIRPDGSIDESAEQSAESWTGSTYGLAAFMIGRGLVDEGWQTAHGVFATTYGRGLWFRTPEAYLQSGAYRAAMYLRPLAIWAIEHALRGGSANGNGRGRSGTG